MTQNGMNWTGDPGNMVTVTVAQKTALLAELSEHFEDRRGFTIATLNLDHAVKLARDPEFKAAYASHSHITADGNPVVWLSRLAGQSDVQLIPGSELVEPVISIAASKGVAVAFFGATDDSLSAAAAELEKTHPELKVVLKLAPPMGFDPVGSTADDAIEKIKASGARLVLLALGAPRQERFAARASRSMGDVGFLSIGAGLDFVSGAQKRAPAWVQSIAAEWLWRMLLSPRRLAGRYAACILALPRLTARSIQARLANGS